MIDYQQGMLLNTNNETRDGKISLPEIDLLGKIWPKMFRLAVSDF